MAKKKESSKSTEDILEQTNDLLRKLLIVQLGLAGIPQAKIRTIVGVDMNQINAIVKNLKGVKGG